VPPARDGDDEEPAAAAAMFVLVKKKPIEKGNEFSARVGQREEMRIELVALLVAIGFIGLTDTAGIVWV
jgi:hypothetical protein